MTLASAVARLRARTGVDLDTEVDITAAVDTTSEIATTELMKAARKVSRDTYFLFTLNSALTLTACTTGADATAELDLLDTSTAGHKSALPIFHCYGIHINGSWLTEVTWQYLLDNCDYLTDAANSKPSLYVPISPSHVRFHNAPDSTAVAASDNYAVGYYLHPTYTYTGDSAKELKGPAEFHELIIERAYLDLTEGLVEGRGALQRRAIAEAAYQKKAAAFKAQNVARAGHKTRRASAGNQRKIFSIGSGS